MITFLRKPPFDLFVSYARCDDVDGFIRKLLDPIAEAFHGYAGRDLRVFLDTASIETMGDWGEDIRGALISAPVMLAVLSPAYVASWHCRKEWRLFVEQEIQRSMLGLNIQPIYYIHVPDSTDLPSGRVREDLLRRQLAGGAGEIARPWAEGGLEALERADVRQRLEAIGAAAYRRCQAVAAAQRSETNIPQANPDFVGRVEDLRRLRETLGQTLATAIVGVNGLGGIGKTELAFTYAHAYAGHYPGGRFFVKAELLGEPWQVLLEIAEYLGFKRTDLHRRLDADGSHEPVLRDLQKALLSRLDELGPMLIILDNVGLPPDVGEGIPGLVHPGRLREAIPARAEGRLHLLATTRLPPASLGDAGRRCVTVDALEPEDGLRLLERLFGFANEAEEQAAIAIVRCLGGHALALECVGRHLASLAGTPERGSYAELLVFVERDVLKGIKPAADDPYTLPFRDQQLVDKAMSLLLGPTLDRLGDLDFKILEVAALLPPDTVDPLWIIDVLRPEYPQIEDQEALLASLRRLDGLRLLVLPENHSFARMHRVVQGVVRDRTSSESRALHERRIYEIAERFGREMGGDMYVFNSALADLLAVAALAQHWSDRETKLDCMLALMLSRPLELRGRGAESRRLIQTAFFRLERMIAADPDDPGVLRTYGIALIRQGDKSDEGGRINEARELYEKAITTFERGRGLSPGEEQIGDLAMALVRLGSLEAHARDLTRARELHSRAVALLEGQVANREWNYRLKQKLVRYYEGLRRVLDDLGDSNARDDCDRRTWQVLKRIREDGKSSFGDSWMEILEDRGFFYAEDRRLLEALDVRFDKGC